MISRHFKAPHIDVELQERPYKFGENIDLEISVTADFEYKVREGQVELMCDGVFTQSRVIMIPDRSTRISAFHPRALSHQPLPQVMIPKRISEEQRFRIPVGSTVFAHPGWITAGTITFDVSLPITSYPPARAGDSGVKYELVTTLDVVLGRDATHKKLLTVVFA